MHEVDALPREVAERVQFPLPGTPVELMGPVRNEAPQPVQFGALFPPYAGNLVGPSCLVQPCPQIVEHLIRNVNPKRLHYNNSLLAAAAASCISLFATILWLALNTSDYSPAVLYGLRFYHHGRCSRS